MLHNKSDLEKPKALPVTCFGDNKLPGVTILSGII